MKKNKNKILFIAIVIIALVIIIIDFNIGNVKIPFKSMWQFFYIFDDSFDNYYNLLKEFRFTRVFAAILAGAALSVAGLLMQTIFKNPLADASILGVSSGAGLGVAIVVLSSKYFLGIELQSNIIQLVAAAIGATLVLCIILFSSIKVQDMLSVLIIGILISGVISAIISILQFFANNVNLKSYVLWTMGSLNGIAFNEIMLLIPIVSITLLIAFLMSKNLNIILLGENFAKTMGININFVKIIIFILVSILTGSITAFCGPIGFIGIISPHVARWIFNTSNHFLLIPTTILIGIIFMLFGDILSNVILKNGILPINAIISILGTPFILWIVITNKRTII